MYIIIICRLIRISCYKNDRNRIYNSHHFLHVWNFNLYNFIILKRKKVITYEGEKISVKLQNKISGSSKLQILFHYVYYVGFLKIALLYINMLKNQDYGTIHIY